MPSASATRRASSTSLTEQQPESLSPPHSFRVTPTTSWPCVAQQRGGDRRVDPARHHHEHPHGRRLATPSAAAGATAAGQHGSRRAVDVGVGGGPPEREPQRAARPARGARPWRPARATAPARRWRSDDPADAATPASSSRNSSASRSTPAKQRCTMPGDLLDRSPPATRTRRTSGDRRVQAGDEAVGAAPRPASTVAVALGRAADGQRGGERRRRRRRRGCRCAARAPGRRRRSSGASGVPARARRARRCPSARRPCGR